MRIVMRLLLSDPGSVLLTGNHQANAGNIHRICHAAAELRMTSKIAGREGGDDAGCNTHDTPPGGAALGSCVGAPAYTRAMAERLSVCYSG